MSEPSIASQIGATSISPTRMAYNAVTEQVLFANQAGESEGVIGLTNVTAVSDWTLY